MWGVLLSHPFQIAWLINVGDILFKCNSSFASCQKMHLTFLLNFKNLNAETRIWKFLSFNLAYPFLYSCFTVTLPSPFPSCHFSYLCTWYLFIYFTWQLWGKCLRFQSCSCQKCILCSMGVECVKVALALVLVSWTWDYCTLIQLCSLRIPPCWKGLTAHYISAAHLSKFQKGLCL